MKATSYILLFLCLCLAVSCSDEGNEPEPSVEVIGEIEFTADTGLRQTVSVTSSSGWKAVSSASWLRISPSQGAAGTVKVTLSVDENRTGQSRTASVTLTSGNISRSITVRQDKTDIAADGTVVQMQRATAGTGIPIVIAGDGFTANEITAGTYDKVMREAMELLFTEEPMKSLRPYFDIYAVTAVSKSNRFGESGETVFSCRLEGGESTLIEGDDELCMKYAQKAGVDLAETLMVVVLNTPQYAGTTSFGYTDEAHNPVEFAICYCPVINHGRDEYFKKVLVHEAVGHGLAKLFDEYAYEDSGAVPQEDIDAAKAFQAVNWGQNIDFTDNTDEVLWKDFLSDNRYDWEGLGVIEGAYTYQKGAYRPSEQSIMRENAKGFNAPSRRAIYRRVMSSAVAGWSDTYEAFVKFDLEHVDKSVIAGRSAVAPAGKRFARPRIAGKAIGKIASF